MREVGRLSRSVLADLGTVVFLSLEITEESSISVPSRTGLFILDLRSSVTTLVPSRVSGSVSKFRLAQRSIAVNEVAQTLGESGHVLSKVKGHTKRDPK